MAAGNNSGAAYRNGVHIRQDSCCCMLGDGEITVELYKSFCVRVYKNGVQQRYLEPLLYAKYPEDGGAYSKFEKTFCGHTITIWYVREDNVYLYGRLVQPDGTVWTGYSGYGVGDEFDDGRYGYRNKDRVRTLKKLLALEDYERYKPSIFHVISMHYGLNEVMPRIRDALYKIKTGDFESLWDDTKEAIKWQLHKWHFILIGQWRRK